MTTPLDVATTVDRGNFPWWVIRKVGEPILYEAKWAETFPNCKWNIVLTGTGTLTTDTTNLRYGDSGSCKLLTTAGGSDATELKTTFYPICKPGDLLAFECKWIQNFAQNTTSFQIGLEARNTTTILQARFDFRTSTLKWQYENGIGTYTDFSTINASNPVATIGNPNDPGVGNCWSWARIVIDPWAGMHYSFECPVVDPTKTVARAITYDMRTVPLTANGAATNSLYLPFNYVIARSANAEPAYVTDWCVSRIPKNTPGGANGDYSLLQEPGFSPFIA